MLSQNVQNYFHLVGWTIGFDRNQSDFVEHYPATARNATDDGNPRDRVSTVNWGGFALGGAKLYKV